MSADEARARAKKTYNTVADAFGIQQTALDFNSETERGR